MFRLSCFNPNHSQKSKKVQHLGGELHSRSEDQERKVNFGSASTAHKVDEDENLSTASNGDHWASQYLDGDSESSREFLKMTGIKKSQSLGCILEKKRSSSDVVEDATDDEEVNQQISVKYLHEKKSMETIEDSLDDDNTFFNQNEENGLIEPFELINCHAHHDSLFSVQDIDQFDSKQHAGFRLFPSDSPPLIAKTRSVANFRVNADKSPEHKTRRTRFNSFEVLHSPNGMVPEFHVGDDEEDNEVSSSQPEFEEDHLDTNGDWGERFDHDNRTTFEICDSHGCISSVNKTDVKLKNLQEEEFLIENYDELDPLEFSYMRIEAWINQIDIGEESVVEEHGESSYSVANHELQVEVEVNVPPILKPDSKSNLAMEVACNYMASLPPTSSTAQMANMGLISIPLLIKFNSLRVLNLSGNAIVQISAGSLPRGLHILNLSKNSIGVIEGLRDLTRLRVLDLSYNRILRIGHGLASCSSLKELYLSDNKIGEVEGLHRLLKLNVLDLKGNKISTAKGLGQLAANYASLQAINLEGNPAQRNVGDEQLKKYLLGLLPNLTHYNKHAVKSNGAKELLDRGLRTDHKLPRRGSQGSLSRLGLKPVRPSYAAGHLPKQSKGKNVEALNALLPPTRSKPKKNLPEIDKKMVDGTLRANGELDGWEKLVLRGLGGPMAAVLSSPRKLKVNDAVHCSRLK